jgi:hypothetical protein
MGPVPHPWYSGGSGRKREPRRAGRALGLGTSRRLAKDTRLDPTRPTGGVWPEPGRRSHGRQVTEVERPRQGAEDGCEGAVQEQPASATGELLVRRTGRREEEGQVALHRAEGGVALPRIGSSPPNALRRARLDQKKLPIVNWKSTSPSHGRRLNGTPHSKRSGPSGEIQRTPQPHDVRRSPKSKRLASVAGS